MCANKLKTIHNSRKYSDKEIVLWAKLYKKVSSISVISKKFGINASTINAILHRYSKQLNIKFRKDTDKELAEKKLQICNRCKKTLPFENFSIHNTGISGLKKICKSCNSKESKVYKTRLKNRNIINFPENKRCYKCGKIKDSKAFHKNSSNQSGLDDRCKDCAKGRYDSNKYKIYYNNNIKRIIEKRRQDINTKIASNLRARLWYFLKNNQKVGSAVKDLGCSVGELKQYLEKQFYTNIKNDEKMTWGNYGFYGWHIDHIIPLSSFDLTKRKQFLKACHYTNLQPLWAEDNLKKGDKI